MGVCIELRLTKGRLLSQYQWLTFLNDATPIRTQPYWSLKHPDGHNNAQRGATA